MKAMVLGRAAPVEEKPLSREDRQAAAPAPDEVSIAVEACAVCRTDVHIAEGEVSARLPIVPGHQAAGRITSVGARVEGFQTGDRVGVGWMASVCGVCSFCRTGRENLCEEATFTGRDRDGGFAETMTARSEWVYRLPEEFSAAEAAPLLCAGIIGYRALRLSGIEPGGRLGLFGFGASAHLAIQVALDWRCEVFVFTRQEGHRQLALGMGAAWAGGSEDNPGALLDAAVTFAPAGSLVPAALSRLARGGTLAINAIHMSPIPSFEYEKVAGERVIRSVTNSTRRDGDEFLALAERIPIRTVPELSRLEDANEALLSVKRASVRGAAVLAMR